MTLLSIPDAPFVGLRPFRTGESLLFFGRRQQAVELLDRLHGTRFVSVIGSSGSGKSSLVRAGLIPKLEAGFLVEDRDRWFSATITPGEAPLANLAAGILAAVSNSNDPAAVSSFVQKIRDRGAQAILEALRPALDNADANFLIVIDQFEELFRLGLRTAHRERRDEATDFVSILLTLTEQRNVPVYVVFTMRSDFLGDCDAFYGLPEAMNRSQYLVPRLTRLQRREAIEGPVNLYRQTITAQLLDRVLNDAGDESDQLPIMQHALLRTWEKWQQNGYGPLELVHYQAIGTMQEALSRDAAAALKGLSDQDLLVTRQMFQALTDTDAANRRIRRPARLSELQTITGASPQKLMEIIDRFCGHGRSFLIVSEDRVHNDALVDICHESLIRQWKQLRDWVDDESKSGKMYRRVAESAERYAVGQEGLLGDPQLQLALNERQANSWNKLWAHRYHPDYDQAMSFLEASRQERDRLAAEKERQQRRDRRKTRALFALSLLIFLLVGAVFPWAWRTRRRALQVQAIASQEKAAADEAARVQLNAQAAIKAEKIAAEKQRVEAEADHRRLMGLRLGAEALSRFSPSANGMVQSGILAIESLRYQPTFEGRKALAQVLRLTPVAPKLYQGHKHSVRAVAFSRDGHWMASGSEDGTFVLWDLANHMEKRVLAADFRTAPSAFGLAFSYDSHLLAGGGMGAIRIWNTGTSGLVQELNTQGGFVRSLALSPDGTRLAAVLRGSGVKIFQRADNQWAVAATGEDTENVEAVAFLADKLVSAGGSVFNFRFEQYGAWLTDVDLLQPSPLPLSQGEKCRSLSLNDHMSLAALCDQRILLLQSTERGIETLGKPQVNGADFSVSYGVSLSQDDKYVAAVDNNSIIQVFDRPMEELSRLMLLPSSSVAFAPDGKFLAAGLQNGSIALWPTTRGTEAVRLPIVGVTGLAFSPDERKLVTTDGDGILRINEFLGTSGDSKSQETHSLPLAGDLGRPVFSPNGRYLAIRADETVRVINADSWKTIVQYSLSGKDGVTIRFSQDGRKLLLLEPTQVRCFETGKWRETMPRIIRDFSRYALSPDEQLLATFLQRTGNGHHYIRLGQVWSLSTGKELAWEETGREDRDGPSDRPSHGGAQGLIKVSKKWKEITINDEVSPNGQWHFNLNRYSSTLELKEASSDRLVGKLEHDDDLIDATFSPRNRWLATSSKDGTVRLWPLQPQDLIAQACQLLPRNLTQKEWKDLNLEGDYHKTCPSLP